MRADMIRLHTEQGLLDAWARDRELLPDSDAEPPKCLRCGMPLRGHLAENALSRAVDVYVCPACGADEALRDIVGDILPVNQWYGALNGLLPQDDYDGAVLTAECSFQKIYDGPKKALPLNSFSQYPVSLVTYCRADYDGYRWWPQWFGNEADRVEGDLAKEIDAFQGTLMKMSEFASMWAMERMCRLYAQKTADKREFNLYSETDHFNIWIRLNTREKDYNLYVYYYLK